MKLNTSKYKLIKNLTADKSLAEQASVKAQKDGLKDESELYQDITKEIENFGKPILVPLIVVEDVDGNTKYHGAGYDFDEVEEFVEILKEYTI